MDGMRKMVTEAELKAMDKGKLIPDILCDFDGVLCETGHWPEIGPPRRKMIDYIISLQRKGHRITIYTCRDWWHRNNIEKWCDEQGFTPDVVVCGKPLGIIVDDLSVNPVVKKPTVEGLVEKLNNDWVKNDTEL
jgi:hypothetical protein